MKKENKSKGVTLITLSITIVVLTILAGIVIYSGKNTIEKAKLEELKTNMLLIKAKAREYVEDANFKMGINPDSEKKEEIRKELYEDKAKLEKASNIPSNLDISESDKVTCYWLTEETQNNWGLSKIESKEDEKYLIQFKEDEVTVEVYNTKGYNNKYSLTQIEQIQE